MAIGQELADIPFGDMVRNLAAAVAEGQLALDRSSIETLKFLADEANAVALIPEIAEVIEKAEQTVKTPTAEDPARATTIETVRVRSEPAPPVKTTLLQAGILPTFYQFTEAVIDVKLSITMRRTAQSETQGRPGFAGRSVMAFAAPFNFRSKNTYSYEASGTSALRITMRPVPPPPRLMPDITTINTLTTPPTVTRAER